jgi:hypothetical protein
MVTIKKVVIANPYSVKVVPDKEHGDYIVHGAEDSSGFLFPNHNTATHTFQRVHLDTVEAILLGEVCRV